MSPVEGELTSEPAQGRSHSGRDLDFEAALGRRIKAARLAAGMTQRVLGEAVGIAYQKLQKYELGKDRIAVSTLQRIARALNIHPGSLFDDPMPRVGGGTLDVMVAWRAMEIIQAIPDALVASKLLALLEEIGKAGALPRSEFPRPAALPPVVGTSKSQAYRPDIKLTRAVIAPLVKLLRQAGTGDAGGLAQLLG